ncbi:unnamed protein product [Adineta steineri]|uniref:Transmembrane protein n=1 Tax=Adineta steineri TaxID=433720 RepID=A0A813RSX4_9BILA|nr:unnamed protein product [Adineta steineri]CAF1414066.1 unnamed protein product [Adineta steineri]
MTSTVESPLHWNYWATIIYIFGMFGYLTIDTINYLFAPVDDDFILFVHTCLTILFVIDAILYTIDWYMTAVRLRENKDEPVHYRSELIACIFQNLGSYLYLLSALLLFDKSAYIELVLLFQFFGTTAFVIESCFVFLGWRISFRRKPSTNPKRGCVSQDVSMWAHIFYIIASLLYLCATSLAYRIYSHLNIIHPSGVLILLMLGDFFYLFDAYLYYECWKRDKQEYDANTEQQNLMQLNVVKQLTTENYSYNHSIDEDS